MADTKYDKNTFSKFIDDFQESALEAAYEAFGVVAGIMQKYPRKRKGQKYIRTFTFMRAWRVRKTPRYAEIKNYAQQHGIFYPGYVVGNASGNKQAWMHVGRWKNFRKLIDNELKSIVDKTLIKLKLKAPFVSK